MCRNCAFGCVGFKLKLQAPVGLELGKRADRSFTPLFDAARDSLALRFRPLRRVPAAKCAASRHHNGRGHLVMDVAVVADRSFRSKDAKEALAARQRWRSPTVVVARSGVWRGVVVGPTNAVTGLD